MSPPDYSNGLANTDLFITHCLASCFILLSATPLFLRFKREIQHIFVCIGNIRKCTYFSTVHIFETLYGWYTLWKELRQLQPYEQQHKQLKTDGQLVQTSPLQEEFITEVREQWIQPPLAEKATFFQDLQQDFQVSNAEYSLDLHVPNISLERIHSPLVVHNDMSIHRICQWRRKMFKIC